MVVCCPVTKLRTAEALDRMGDQGAFMEAGSAPGLLTKGGGIS